LGGTYSNSAGSNIKLKVYEDATNIGGMSVSGGQLEINAWSSGKIAFYRGTTQSAIIDINGNVGIGTSSPTTILQVVGAGVGSVGTINIRGAQAHLGFTTSGGTFKGWSGYFNSAAHGSDLDLNIKTGYAGASNIRIGSNGDATHVFIAGGGNVGIGTTVPAYNLDVTGSISADAFLGKSFGMTGASGSTAIYDAYVSNGVGEVYELIAAGSPNAAGSSGYQDVLYGKIIIGTGYNGSRVTTYINYVQENPDPRSLYNSGLGTSLSASICFKSGSSEVTNKPAGQSTKIRVKIGSYINNAYAGYTTVRVKKLF